MESIKYIVDAWYNEATAFYSCKAFEYMRYICIHRAPIIRTSQKQGPSITANAFASFETNDFPMETYQNQHTHTHTHIRKSTNEKNLENWFYPLAKRIKVLRILQFLLGHQKFLVFNLFSSIFPVIIRNGAKSIKCNWVGNAVVFQWY